jgi:hypothetical protein
MATTSTRMFEPLIGSDALFLDPSNGTPNQPQSASTSASDPPPSSDSQDPAPSQQAEAPPRAQGTGDQQAAGPGGEEGSGSGDTTGSTGGQGASVGNGEGAAAGGGNSGNGGGTANAGGETGGGGGGAGGGAGAGNGGGSQDVFGGLLDHNGVPIVGDTIGNLGDTVAHTVGATGSGGPLNIVNGNGLLDGLGTNGIVADLGHTVNGLTNGGSPGDVLNTVGQGAGNLLDGVLNGVNDVAASTPVGGVLNDLGSNVVNGTVGGAGLLDGTPLAGLQGNGALVGTNLLQADNSSPSSLIQVGAGTDQSNGLINISAASDHGPPSSNNIADANVGPSTSGNGTDATLLGAQSDSTPALLNADGGQHQGPTLATVNAGTNADQFQFPALNGTGADALVGQVGQDVGQVTGGEVTGTPIGGTDVLPLSAGADGHVLADIGAAGAVDAGSNHVNDGTQIMLNTPLHGAIA